MKISDYLFTLDGLHIWLESAYFIKIYNVDLIIENVEIVFSWNNTAKHKWEATKYLDRVNVSWLHATHIVNDHLPFSRSWL